MFWCRYWRNNCEDGIVPDRWCTSGKMGDSDPTQKNEGAAILPDVAASIEELCEKKKIAKDQIEGVGIGVPAPVTEVGIVQIQRISDGVIRKLKKKWKS